MNSWYCLAILATAPVVTLAVTPAELDASLKSGKPPVIIDLRITDEYQRSHIPGAINIPHRIIAEKQFPPLGRVIVYCDGLGSTYVPDCLAALRAKPGIQPEALEGGYAAWETFTNVTVAAEHVGLRQPRTITFEDLLATRGEGIVLVDVRREPAAVAKARNQPVKEKLDLASYRQRSLPKASLSGNIFKQLAGMKGKKARFDRASSLFVVVDNDDATAMQTAERIQQAGYKRVVVLAGGEEIIRRQGRAGLSRQGAAAPIVLDPTLSPPPLPKP